MPEFRRDATGLIRRFLPVPGCGLWHPMTARSAGNDHTTLPRWRHSPAVVAYQFQCSSFRHETSSWRWTAEECKVCHCYLESYANQHRTDGFAPIAMPFCGKGVHEKMQKHLRKAASNNPENRLLTEGDSRINCSLSIQEFTLAVRCSQPSGVAPDAPSFDLACADACLHFSARLGLLAVLVAHRRRSRIAV